VFAPGPVCGVCADGYSFRRSTQQCEPCSDDVGLDAMTILFLVLLFLASSLAAYLYFCTSFREQVKTADDLYILVLRKLGLLDRDQDSVNALEENAVAIRKRLQARFKIYVTLWQIVSLLPFTLDLKFPSAYKTIASILNVFNLGVSVSSLVTCSTSSSFDAIDNLVFETVYPVVVVSGLWLLRTAHLSVRRAQDPASNARISSIYFGVFLVFTYLILPVVTLTIFQIFSCQDVNPDDVESGYDRYYMTVDYNMSCSSSKYRFGLGWAIASIFVYPVGIPSYYFYILYSARDDIKNRDVILSEEAGRSRDAHLQSMKLLFEFYKPHLWYWEVVETIYRLLLTGVLVVVAQGTGTQIIVGTVVVLFYLKVCDIYMPYEDAKVQLLRVICHWQIFFVFFLALILKADFSSVEKVALDILLVLVITTNIVLDVLMMGWNKCVGGNSTSNSSVKSTLPAVVVVSPLVSSSSSSCTTTTTTAFTEGDEDFSKEGRTEKSVQMSDIVTTPGSFRSNVAKAGVEAGEEVEAGAEGLSWQSRL
jgi:hypothetical protein